MPANAIVPLIVAPFIVGQPPALQTPPAHQPPAPHVYQPPVSSQPQYMGSQRGDPYPHMRFYITPDYGLGVETSQ